MNYMKEQILIFLLLSLGIGHIQAQWDKKDSLWLQDVLSGKEKLQLNTETMRAIKGGTFLQSAPSRSLLRSAPSKNTYFIYKDYSQYLKADTAFHHVALKNLPPSVFWLYQLPQVKTPAAFRNLKVPDYARTALMSFDMASLTSRKEYVHRRNAAKAEVILKDLDDLPRPDIIRKRKKYRNDHPEALLQDSIGLRDTVPVSVKKDSLSIPVKE